MARLAQTALIAAMVLPLAIWLGFFDNARSRWRRWAPVGLIAMCIPMSVSRSGALAVGGARRARVGRRGATRRTVAHCSELRSPLKPLKPSRSGATVANVLSTWSFSMYPLTRVTIRGDHGEVVVQSLPDAAAAPPEPPPRGRARARAPPPRSGYCIDR